MKILLQIICPSCSSLLDKNYTSMQIRATTMCGWPTVLTRSPLSSSEEILYAFNHHLQQTYKLHHLAEAQQITTHFSLQKPSLLLHHLLKLVY